MRDSPLSAGASSRNLQITFLTLYRAVWLNPVGNNTTVLFPTGPGELFPTGAGRNQDSPRWRVPYWRVHMRGGTGITLECCLIHGPHRPRHRSAPARPPDPRHDVENGKKQTSQTSFFRSMRIEKAPSLGLPSPRAAEPAFSTKRPGVFPNFPSMPIYNLLSLRINT